MAPTRGIRFACAKTFVKGEATVYMASRAAAKHMATQQSGSIMNISTACGIVPDVSHVSYGTGTTAINYLTNNVTRAPSPLNPMVLEELGPMRYRNIYS